MQEVAVQKEKIGRIFIKAGLINQEQLNTALEENKKNPKELLGETLVRLNFVSEQEVARALSYQLNIPYLDLTKAVVEPIAIELIPLKLATEYQILPVDVEKRDLILAMKNPLDIEAIDMARFTTGLNIRPVIAAPSDLKEAINRYYATGESINQIIQNVAQQEGIEFIKEELLEEDILELKTQSEMTPIVRLVNSVISQGIFSRASDIHIEPQEKIVLVRNRVDGILDEAMQIPKWVQGALTSRIKIMASMDIAEKRIPQDGKIKLKIESRLIDLRVSTLPTQYGEKVVIRVLDTSKSAISVEELGLLPDDLDKVKELINLPQGIILVCGPTGSGKSTTLYAMINQISRKKINVVTLEDPIEYEIRGVNQVQINEKTGLTFAKSLRSVLRQDPNVIFVGEIRDIETAEIAMKASMTGHLVLSTLHTNDAVSTIYRLIDLGVETYLIASSLSGIIAQRLVRIICDHCREEYKPVPEMLKRIEARAGKKISFPLYKGKGCDACQQTSYRGRKGIYEILVITGEIRELISKGAPEGKIRQVARKSGMRLLMESALEKVKQGITTVEELDRVVFSSEEPEPGIELKCPRCQKVLELDWQLCPYCGYKLKESLMETGVANSFPQGVNPSRVEQLPMEEVVSHAETVKITDLQMIREITSFKDFKILIVDDNDKLVRELVFFLNENQFIVTSAANGKEALKIIARDKPHLIITDIIMPEMDGLELIKRLRQDITTAFIPVIILSQKKAIEDRLKGFEVGTDDYLPKPCSLDELLSRVKAVLKRVYR